MYYLALLLLTACAAGTNPGIRVALTNETVSNAFNLYAATTISLLEKNYGEFSKEFSFLDVKAKITLHNTTVTSITFNPILTYIELQEPAFIIFHVSNITCFLEANYTIKLLASSDGWLKVRESNSDLILNVSITNTPHGKPVLVFNGALLTIGSAEISSDMDFELRDFMQREINDHLQDLEVYAPQFLSSVFPEINSLLSAVSLQFPVYDNLFIDLSLVDTMQVASKFLSAPLNGTFMSKSSDRTTTTPQPIPPFGSMPEPIQLLLSDYTINSLLAAEWFSVSYFLEQLPPEFPLRLNTDEISLFIPQLRNHFGANKPIAFSVTPNRQAGLPIYETNGNFSLSFCANLEILCNPDGEGWQSGLTLAASIETSFTGWVTNNVGTATLWSLSIPSIDIVNTSVGPIDIGSLTIFLRTAVSQFIPQMNALLSEFSLPFDQFLIFSILKDDAVVEDGYLSAGVEIGLTFS